MANEKHYIITIKQSGGGGGGNGELREKTGQDENGASEGTALSLSKTVAKVWSSTALLRTTLDADCVAQRREQPYQRKIQGGQGCRNNRINARTCVRGGWRWGWLNSNSGGSNILWATD